MRTPSTYSIGVLPLPVNVNMNTLPERLKRDYVLSWNLTLQKQFGDGLLASAGYVATRGVDIPHYQNQNYQSVGGGAASQRFNQLFGTTADLNWMAPLNHTHYDS